jgi:hypothetical protein
MPWTIQKRIKVYPKLILAIYLVFTMYTFLSGRGLLDAFGNPLGSDFLFSWSISKMVLTDDAKEVYNQEKIFEIQKKITGVYHRYPAYYPPSSLIFMAPLALLPYIPSFILWMGMTLLFYFLILYRIAPNPATIWLALAFPGVYINFSFGQNAFLVGALIGGGLLLMDRAPLAAGFLLGLSIYKPHIAILIPFVLLTQKKWKVFASMLLTIASLILISLIAFGIEAWAAFWKNLPNAIEIIEKREIRLYNMTSVMAAALLLGVNAAAAKIAHGIIAGFALAMLLWIWFKNAPFFLRASSLILATTLISPYIHIYDLALLVMPIAWLGWEAFSLNSWPPGLKYHLAAVWIMPLFVTAVARGFEIQLAPLFIISLLLFCFYWSKKFLKK